MLKTNTTIQIESSNGIREVHLETSLLSKRKIFISEEINMEMANDFVRQIMYLESENDNDIDIYINSPGGEIMAGLLMYDVIQAARSTINIYCVGEAYSMAAVLLACGRVGHRFILPHSKVMIHEPLIRGGVGGSATNIRNISESIMETKEIIVDLLQKHVGKTREEIEESIANDNYMKPEEAIMYGICDKVDNRLY